MNVTWGWTPAGATDQRNPLLEALVDLVDSYDDETQQVTLVAIRAAREVLAGRLPNHWPT